MPGVPAFTIAEASHIYHPVDTFVLRSLGQPSILDTVFVSKRYRRAVYTTTTHGSRTSLWRVAASGALTEIARIDWEHELKVTSAGDGSLRNGSKPGKRCPMLTFGGKMIRADEFLQKGRGWFSGDSRVFSVAETEYKWKSGTENTGTNDSQHTWNQNSAYPDVWKVWRCVATRTTASLTSPTAFGIPFPPSYGSTPLATEPRRSAETPLTAPTPLLSDFSSSGTVRLRDQQFRSPPSAIRSTISPILNAPAPPTVLARFAPPQLGLVHNEISLFPPLFPSDPNPNHSSHLLECVLISAVLLAVTKGEWRQVQSTSQPLALQAVFIAEAVGEVPPYTLGAGWTPAAGAPITAQGRTYSGRSRTSSQPPPELEERMVPSPPWEDSDRTPLLPRRVTHRASRSNPFHIDPTSPFNIRPRSRANSARPSDPRHVTHGPPPLRRPVTADSSPAGDGVFSRRRPPLQAVNSMPASEESHRPSTIGNMMPLPSMINPPMYK